MSLEAQTPWHGAVEEESEVRFLVGLTLVVLLVACWTVYPAYWWGDVRGLVSWAVAAAVSFLSMLFSYLIFNWSARKPSSVQTSAVYGGFVVRLLLVFVVLFALAKLTSLNVNQLVVWLMVFYLSSLAFEVYFVIKELKKSSWHRGVES